MFHRPIGVLFGLALAFVIAVPALGHTPSASLTCIQGNPTLQVDLVNYNDPGPNLNIVGIKIDGSFVSSSPANFGGSYHRTVDAGDPFVGHTATVVVVAWDGPTNPNWSKTYSLSVGPCQEQPTPTPTATPEPTPTPEEPTPTATPEEPTSTPTPVEPTPTPVEPTPTATVPSEGGGGPDNLTPPPTATMPTGPIHSDDSPFLLIVIGLGVLAAAATLLSPSRVRR